jgi:uncharacterized hydrophobic protein (TIGR00271 family)
MLNKIRDSLARKLGVTSERKADLYIDLARSTTLTDPAYWLQTIFAAGIATLGLVLNSPAVIIGAMLISPLMGPILAGGLALASGDLILGLRAALNLALSCILAVAFAALLVTILPFKEVTGEIASRMHPTTLDLTVAFFSGAIGSIATCKELKGVVTSIPGVAIAVALMPPLGVVGFGAAVALTANREEGMRVALGGGLLFLTNLVAITFTAMIVFLALHIDVMTVKEKVDGWHRTDEQSVRFHRIFARLPEVPGARHIGTLPGRLLMIVILILVILIPLSRSFNQLRQELTHRQKENRIRQIVTQTWRTQFANLPDGKSRSFLDRVIVADNNGKLTLQLRIITSKPLVAEEKAQFTRSLAASLGAPQSNLDVQLIEVPTATLKPELSEPSAPVVLSVQQIQQHLFETIDQNLQDLYFPPPAQLVDYRLSTPTSDELGLTLSYLSDREIDDDGKAAIAQDVKRRLNYPSILVKLKRVPTSLGRLFDGRGSRLNNAGLQILDQAVAYLQQYGRLRMTVAINNSADNSLNQERLKTLREHLTATGPGLANRLDVKAVAGATDLWSLSLMIAEPQTK